ncbi:MAG: efflux RND transporter periplasmic adaptor subunit [Pseudomonadales bacterium]|jgi:RND family efflux transporter MFP subunit|nr:efflux RND transporter periplasmic adaptor subunit [Pseudomonadales bacterium]
MSHTRLILGNAPSVVLAMLCMWLLLSSVYAFADLTVSYVNIQRQAGFASERVYAGKTLPSRSSELGFKRGGEIAQVLVDIGDVVEKGQVLARLDSQTLASNLEQAQANTALAQANLSAAKAEAQLAANTEKRFRTLREQGNTSKQIYDEAKLSFQTKRAQYQVAQANVKRALAAANASKIALAEAAIKAPFDGIIQSRYMDEGTQILGGTPAVKLIELGPIKAHVGVPSESLASLTIGERYNLSWNGKAQPARLMAISPEVDPNTRTLNAVFKVNADIIPIGAVVELLLEQRVAIPGFWLPVSALTASDRGLWGVYVVNAENIIERRLVEVIHNEASRAFVRGLLSDKERVVNSGVQRIVPGQSVLPLKAQESANVNANEQANAGR